MKFTKKKEMYEIENALKNKTKKNGSKAQHPRAREIFVNFSLRFPLL
jgi:hypothetical protein